MRQNYSLRRVVIAVLIALMTMTVTAFAGENGETTWKPAENQEKFSGITCSKGMLSVAEKGSEIVVNDNATITLNVTTKPMTSTKYTKIAISTDEITDENVEQIADSVSVTVNTATDIYIGQFDGVNYGQKPFYWSVFSYTLPIEEIETPINIIAYNVLKKVDDATKTYEEDLASAAWVYKSTWTVNSTQELVGKLCDKAAALGGGEAADKMTAAADKLAKKMAEAAVTEAEAADVSAYSDENKAAIEAALGSLKALLADGTATAVQINDAVTTLNNAISKAEQDKKAAEEAAAKEAAIAKVKKAKVSGLKVKAAKKKMTVSWKKNTTFGGYQIQYKVGSKTTTVKIAKASIVKKVIKKLSSNKKYTVKIRGYKDVSGTMTYGQWSAAKKVKIK